MPAASQAPTMWLAVAPIISTVLRSPGCTPESIWSAIVRSALEHRRDPAEGGQRVGHELGGGDAGRVDERGGLQHAGQGREEHRQLRLVEQLGQSRVLAEVSRRSEQPE